MPDFGLIAIPTHYTIKPVELGRWAEAHGFDSLWMGEHSHIPTSRQSQYPLGGDLPQMYKEFFDPFVGLTAVAAVTEKIKVGTSVCLVPEHNTINLAKTVACLDRVANGRFLFGIGAGWNAEEMADHGVEFKNRWKITRERILAMREIWTKEVAEFHGKYVNFDSMWCWPKPVQPGGPKVLLGAWSKFVPKRVADYCDGWIPGDVGVDLGGCIEEIKVEMRKRNRSFDDLDLRAMTAFEFSPQGGMEHRIHELLKMGFQRILFLLTTAASDKQWPLLERYYALTRKFN